MFFFNILVCFYCCKKTSSNKFILLEWNKIFSCIYSFVVVVVVIVESFSVQRVNSHTSLFYFMKFSSKQRLTDVDWTFFLLKPIPNRFSSSLSLSLLIVLSSVSLISHLCIWMRCLTTRTTTTTTTTNRITCFKIPHKPAGRKPLENRNSAVVLSLISDSLSISICREIFEFPSSGLFVFLAYFTKLVVVLVHVFRFCTTQVLETFSFLFQDIELIIIKNQKSIFDKREMN